MHRASNGNNLGKEEITHPKPVGKSVVCPERGFNEINLSDRL
jgi:hypothetical protein